MQNKPTLEEIGYKILDLKDKKSYAQQSIINYDKKINDQVQEFDKVKELNEKGYYFINGDIISEKIPTDKKISLLLQYKPYRDLPLISSSGHHVRVSWLGECGRDRINYPPIQVSWLTNEYNFHSKKSSFTLKLVNYTEINLPENLKSKFIKYMDSNFSKVLKNIVKDPKNQIIIDRSSYKYDDLTALLNFL